MFDTDRPSWQNPRVLGILSVVFLCGSVVGALIMRADLTYWPHHSASSKAETMLSYTSLTKELNLTPQQCQQLKTILDDYARYHQDLQAQLDDWKATGKNHILRILDANQRARFEELTKE
jgi:Spy/CpxP family protein refolding chaperone